MNVEVYDYNGLGTIIDPESDTKVITVILIGKQTVKCNPRPGIIYITGGKVTENCAEIEALKTYCAENKVVLICPKAVDEEELGKTYQYVYNKYKDLNIDIEQVTIKADDEHMDAAEELVEYVLDEFDTELEDASVFTM
ncbi:hypothetical protein NE683_08385 [Bariatricus massiliensis]|uniref:Uncharacterized protein n=1 Tax=Bariatricus massiliensis TaxID=1745713 RepID=A0ABS8DK75_9FIRM|nr:hypothetical protein [Bariatricus massiliensis]MCB7305565.1 hypothetical protein [Bariatricus massiliensis]MCB7376119.1 hypothetical protein [Bariatricus massiliensis]MCB7388767.1 hypothetical protein [Bariatricus massiliensis]MCB7412940.1 hypothetical protein [Bariatricus massiliensis]MCQ5253246.1 hypothetical protein [Bariatricus massiliensis]